MSERRSNTLCAVVERPIQHCGDGPVNNIIEAPTESWTHICFHILAERAVWGKYLANGERCVRNSLALKHYLSTGVGVILVRCGVWLGGTKMPNHVFVCNRFVSHHIPHNNPIWLILCMHIHVGFGEYFVPEAILVIFGIFRPIDLKISAHTYSAIACRNSSTNLGRGHRCHYFLENIFIRFCAIDLKICIHITGDA